VANSMREVLPEINLLVNPIKENLFIIVPDSARWEWRIDKDDGDSGLPQTEVQIGQNHPARISRFDERPADLLQP
jgi:hypothetical protein